MSTHRFVCIDLLVNRLVADSQLAGNLLGAPLQTGQGSHLKQNLFVNTSRIKARLRTLMRQILSLAGTISSTTGSTGHFSTNSRFIAPQNMGNLGLCLSCFHKYINLITFGLAEMCISHALLRLAGQKALILIHLSHPTH
jgi:hypothetical protein